MFEESNLFAIMQGKASEEGPLVLRVALDEEARKSTTSLFSESAHALTHCPDGTQKTPQEFHADYTAQPELDEYIEISSFTAPKSLLGVIDNPLSVETYKPHEDELPLIKALFVGSKKEGEYSIALQRFRNAQYLRSSGVHIVFGSNTFTSANSGIWSKISKKVGLSILPTVDAFLTGGKLCFVSSYFAKQIFDLTDYYVEAGKPELEEFAEMDELQVEDRDQFVNGMSPWERRKIASIKNARIVEEHPLSELLGCARELKYDLPTRNGKLFIPADKKQRKQLFQFLDEDVYRGMLTGSVYETSSKRSV